VPLVRSEVWEVLSSFLNPQRGSTCRRQLLKSDSQKYFKKFKNLGAQSGFCVIWNGTPILASLFRFPAGRLVTTQITPLHVPNHPEDGGGMDLRNVGIPLHGVTSQKTGLQSRPTAADTVKITNRATYYKLSQIVNKT
jgi:hypothetical protein